VEASREEVAGGEKLCPKCGRAIELPEEESLSATWAEETQLVNLRDMARMAQEGIEVGVSGEWDTSESESDHPKDE
jgi:hypothetical protein